MAKFSGKIRIALKIIFQFMSFFQRLLVYKIQSIVNMVDFACMHCVVHCVSHTMHCVHVTRNVLCVTRPANVFYFLYQTFYIFFIKCFESSTFMSLKFINQTQKKVVHRKRKQLKKKIDSSLMYKLIYHILQKNKIIYIIKLIN